MYTDWVLIRRLALELRGRCRGSRVHAAGVLPDGRFAVELRGGPGSRGDRIVAFDLFAPTPLVTLEPAGQTLQADFGFSRAAAAALRGMILSQVQSPDEERLIRFVFAARSRFGITSQFVLIAELVPKYANALLLKDNIVVSALKEFAGAAVSARRIAAGEVYEPPPARGKAIPKLLGDITKDPAVVREMVTAQDALPPLHVYRDGAGVLLQAHVVPLRSATGHHGLAPALLPLLQEVRTQVTAKSSHDRASVRRRQLAAALTARKKKISAQCAALRAKVADLAQSDLLRDEGSAIFATLHEMPQAEQALQKEHAREVFAKYRKIANSVPHVHARLAALQETLNGIETLEWELQRARDEDIEDVSQAISPVRGAVRRKPPRRKRPRLAAQTANGSRILIGRSPLENAELTFAVARPDDLWFHAQGVPGAHVILQRDDASVPSAGDIELAAALAAGYSRGQESTKLSVDYTARKYVRKRPGAAPGLVFYTNPRSIMVAPRRLDAES